MINRKNNEVERSDRMDAGSKNKLPDITHLIRSIQRIEGNPDCFGKAEGGCDQTDCFWREYCLKITQKE
jgi:hypothetical protein